MKAPLPWCVVLAIDNMGYHDIVDSTGMRIARCAFKLDAERIVREVNAAPELLDALRGVVRVADRKTVEFDAARAAIAKAESKGDV